ncbi:MAG TPA: ribonuclease J [Candidatus Limnocylindria bacterium]|nr:ribonuclease J [Candidatus Limnocylindria bacterium]
MNQHTKKGPLNGSAKTRGAAIRAQKRTQDDAHKIVSQHADAGQKTQPVRANTVTDAFDKLKVTFLGGLDDVGEKNMAVIEYQNQAIILDCGINLSVDLPGVNYAINDTAYLETIKHKIKAYVITHGHLDHIGGLRHTVPSFPAPIYGSRYTIGLVEKVFEDLHVETGLEFKPHLITAKLDTHQKLKIGNFYVEFIRVTHSLPDAAAVCIDTPVGRIVATGDFRLDPEPLDRMPSDTKRLQELGDQGVLLLLSDSSYADTEGRVPTESTLQQSFYDIIDKASGRIFVATFSSNMNRTQMIINAAVAAGRKVALDGRGMLSYAEIAVRQGILKVPKGTIVPIGQASTIPADQLLVMCTGGQGEPNAALQRMSEGEHKYVNLNQGDTVVVSSTPIPGNEIAYDLLGNRLKRQGVHLFRHPTYQLDGCGPLHVSGHAKREELQEMIQLTRPKFFIPVHAGHLRRHYHAELAIEEGLPRRHVLLPENGDSVLLDQNSIEPGGQVPHGSLLIDQTGSVVNGIVVKDRLMLSEEGILTVILTIDKKSGQLLANPDIVSRGFIAMRDSDELLSTFRTELRRTVQQRYKRVDLDRFKAELKDHLTHFCFSQTGRSPLVIPVVNVVASKPGRPDRPVQPVKNQIPADQKRFAEMRSRLLG